MLSKFKSTVEKKPSSNTMDTLKKLMSEHKIIEQSTLESTFKKELSKYDYLEMLCLAIENHPAHFSIDALAYLVNQADKHGCLSSHNHIRGDKTPLHIAAEAKSLQSIHMLITHKASLEAQNANGDTPLHMAAQNKALDCIRLLMEKGANPNAENKKGLMPTTLHAAIEAKSPADMEAFIKKGASIDTVDAEGNTPLHIATQNKSLECIRSLLDKDAKPNVKNVEGLMPTPLHVAIEEKSYADFEKFIAKGASVDAVDNEGNTPLHVASEKELLQYVRLLIKKGTDPNIKNKNNLIPAILPLAVRNQSLADLALFMEKGAALRVGDPDGNSPMHLAAQLGWLEGVKALLVKDKSAYLLQQKNKKDQTPLELYEDYVKTSNKNNKELANILKLPYFDLEELIDNDVKASQDTIQFVYDHSLIPLTDQFIFEKAIKKCHMPAIEFLLNNTKIDVTKDNKPLSTAIEQYLNHEDERDDDTLAVIRYLLEKGAPGEAFLSSLIKNNDIHHSSFYIVASLMETIFVSHGGRITKEKIETLKKELDPRDFGWGESEVRDRTWFLNSNLNILNFIQYMHSIGIIPGQDHLDRIYKMVADPNLECTDRDNNTVLHLVASYGKNWQHVARWLIDNHAIASIENSKGETALDAAITSENPDEEIVALLLEHGVDPYKKPKGLLNHTEFFSYKADQKHAAFQKHLDKYHSLQDLMHFHKGEGTIPRVEELQLNKSIHAKDEKSNVEKTDEEKNTALHLAAHGGKGWLHVVKFVLENKAYIQAQSKELNTVLHSAVLATTPDLDIIKHLLERGADPSVVNKQGKTAQMYAKDRRLDQAIIDILDPQKNIYGLIKTAKTPISRDQLAQINSSVNISVCDKDEMTLLHLAVVNNDGEAVDWLLKKDPQLINMKNAQGKTALMLAIENQGLYATQLVNILLDYNPDLTIKDKKNLTVFDYTKKLPTLTTLLSESQIKRCQESVPPSAPSVPKLKPAPLLEEKTLLRYSEPGIPPAELVYPSLLVSEEKSEYQEMYQKNLPLEKVEQDSTSRIISLTTTDVLPTISKGPDVVTLMDIKPQEPQKNVISMTARLFSKQLHYKMELLDLFDQLPDTVDSRAILIPLIEAFNKSDFNGLMTTTGSAIHDQIANQFVMELVERNSFYKEIIQHHQNMNHQTGNMVKRSV